MASKGPSKRYGNTNGSNHKGKPTRNINYPWAKFFNKITTTIHFNRHGKEFNSSSQNDYIAKSIKFANNIDRVNNKSVVDKYGRTYKYSVKTNELVIVNSSGIVISYYIVKENGFHYTNNKGVVKWIKIK